MEISISDGTVIKVDEQDAHLLSRGSWKFSKQGRKHYARWCTTVRGKRVNHYLHRVIMNAKPGQIVDHIDGDTRNNCRANLRFTTVAENARNAVKAKQASSRFKGVTKHPDGWHARIWDGKKNVYLGKTQNEVKAAYLYDLASLERHGEFGRRNFLPLV